MVDHSRQIDDLDAAILGTVSYADVFDMPITLAHLHRFLVQHQVDFTDLEPAVSRLNEAGRLGRRDDLVYLPGRDEVLAVHDARTERAATMWDQAQVWGRRVGRVPFVRMVAVTGGLAVDSVAPHDDIDYFIVVRPRRLWLTRLMIIALVRVAARDDIELCPNFIVAETAVAMSEKQVYVARELAQMVPIVGADVCRDVRFQNHWMFDHLPNASLDGDLSRAVPQSVHRWQRATEWLLLQKPFARLERWEMDRKIEKLSAVASRRPEVGAPDESSFSPEVCKGHMVGNAAGIDVAWRERLRTVGVDSSKIGRTGSA